MRTIGQAVGRNLAQLREQRGQTQQEAAAYLRAYGLSWTAANVASIESGRRESIDLGAFVVIAMAYDVAPSSLFNGAGEIRLAADVAVALDVLRGWLDRDGTEPVVTVTGNAARRTIDNLPGDEVSFQADAELAARLGLRPEDVYRAAERVWGRNLHQERDRRLADAGHMTPTQRRTRRGHITRQLTKELEPHLPKPNEQEDG